MALLTNTQEVCDRCRTPRRKVTRYRVGQDGHLVGVLLSREDDKPLDGLMALGTHVPSQSPRVKVWDMDEIEKAKKSQNRKLPPSH